MLYQERYASPPTLERFWGKLDSSTRDHNFRVGWLSGRFAQEQGVSDIERVQLIVKSGGLHDIGKERREELPDFASAKIFTPEERAIMVQRHCDFGRTDLILLGMPPEVVQTAALHHSIGSERFFAQPESTRNIISTVAAADIFDAMIWDNRLYHRGRPPLTFDDVQEEWRKKNLGPFMNAERLSAFQRAIAKGPPIR